MSCFLSPLDLHTCYSLFLEYSFPSLPSSDELLFISHVCLELTSSGNLWALYTRQDASTLSPQRILYIFYHNILLYLIVIALKSSLSPCWMQLWEDRHLACLTQPLPLASTYWVSEFWALHPTLRTSRSALSLRYCRRKSEVYHEAGPCLGSSFQTWPWQDSKPRTGLQSPSAESPATLCHCCGPGSSCCPGWRVSWRVTVGTGCLSIQTEVRVKIWGWQLDSLWYFFS